jgi:hypothetical protein
MTSERRAALVFPALDCAPINPSVSARGLLNGTIGGRCPTSMSETQSLPSDYGRAREKEHLHLFVH